MEGESSLKAAPSGTAQLVVSRPRRATLLKEAAAKAARNASDERAAELEARVRELEQSNQRLHRSAAQLSRTLQQRGEQLEAAMAQVEEAEHLCAEVEGLRGVMAFELDRARSGEGASAGAGKNFGNGEGESRTLALGGPTTPPAIPAALMNQASPGHAFSGKPLLLPGLPAASTRAPGATASPGGGAGTRLVQDLQSSSSLLRHVPTAGMDHLLDKAAQLVLAKGDVALSEGQTPPGMLVVLEGSLEVFHFEGDERVTLQIVSESDILCEMALLTSEPVMSSTVALSAARVLKISREDMEEVFRRFPACVSAVRREAALQIRNALKGSERHRRATVVTRGSPAASTEGPPPFRPVPPRSGTAAAPGQTPRPKAQPSASFAGHGPLARLEGPSTVPAAAHAVPVVEAAGTMTALGNSKYNIARLLQSIPILKSLPQEALTSLVSVVRIKSCISGEKVVAEGDLADEAYLVLEGTLQITSMSFQVALGLANHGDVIGEASMLEDGFRTATVTALTDARLLCIRREHLVAIFRDLPDLKAIMIDLMLKREEENSRKLPRSTFARRKASMMTATAPIIIEVPKSDFAGFRSIPEGDEPESEEDVGELGVSLPLPRGQWPVVQAGGTARRPDHRGSGEEGNGDSPGAPAYGGRIRAGLSAAREVARGISELGTARGRLQARVNRLLSEATGHAQTRDRSATEAKDLTQALRATLQERDALQARVRGLEGEAQEASARAAAAVDEALSLKEQVREGRGQCENGGARAGGSPGKDDGEAAPKRDKGAAEMTLEELQISYEAAAKREREILLRQRDLRSPQRSQFCPMSAGRRTAVATPGFPVEGPSTIGLPDETARSEGLLSALGSVKRQVSGLTRSALVLQAQAGVSAAAMPLEPGHPVIITPGKLRDPGSVATRPPGKRDLHSQLAVIDSLLDNFET